MPGAAAAAGRGGGRVAFRVALPAAAPAVGAAAPWPARCGRAAPAPAERALRPLVSLAGSERSRGSRLCSWQPAVTFPSGNGEWTLGPDADPLQPAFLPELSHRHPGAGLRWEDDGALQTAVQ